MLSMRVSAMRREGSDPPPAQTRKAAAPLLASGLVVARWGRYFFVPHTVQRQPPLHPLCTRLPSPWIASCPSGPASLQVQGRMRAPLLILPLVSAA